MKKMLMLFALSGLVSCASLFAMDEDFKVGYPDDDETYYQNDSEEDFKIGEEEDTPGDKECERVGYIDEDPGQ